MVITSANLVYDKLEDTDQGITYTQRYILEWWGTWSAGAAYSAAYSIGLPIRMAQRTDDTRVYASDIQVYLPDGEHAIYATSSELGTAFYDVKWSQKSLNWDPDPLKRTPDISWGGTDVMETVTVDINGNAIRNSAGQMYANLPQRPVRGAECTITRNEAANPSIVVANYSYTVNSDPLWGGFIAAKQGYMGKIEARRVVESVSQGVSASGSTVYWQVTYPMRFKRDGWVLKLIDNGYSNKTSGGASQPNVSQKGFQFSGPQLLDGNGAVTLNPTIYPPDGYDINEAKVWGILNLPNPSSVSSQYWAILNIPTQISF